MPPIIAGSKRILIPKIRMRRKEALLEYVISDCRKKGAPISGWGRSPNGRIILYEHGKLPQFFFNPFAAVDFLIHAYKLKSRYSHIYETSGKQTKNMEPSTQASGKGILSLEQRVIQNMQKVFDNEARTFGQKDELFILNAMHATCGRNIDRNLFYEVKEICAGHTADLITHALDTYKIHYLRRVLTFVQKMTYKYFSESI